jgi:hypothetical protein
LVDNRGVEPRLAACKAAVFPSYSSPELLGVSANMNVVAVDYREGEVLVAVEDMRGVDRRMCMALAIPIAVLGVSVEPLAISA